MLYYPVLRVCKHTLTSMKQQLEKYATQKVTTAIPRATQELVWDGRENKMVQAFLIAPDLPLVRMGLADGCSTIDNFCRGLHCSGFVALFLGSISLHNFDFKREQ